MHKGQHLLIFIMFLCLFFIALLMGMAGPSIITKYEENAANLVNGTDKIPGGPFVMLTPQLDTYRQQVEGKLWNEVDDDLIIEMNFSDVGICPSRDNGEGTGVLHEEVYCLAEG